MKPKGVKITRSDQSDKKLKAVFFDSKGRKIKTTHFGRYRQAKSIMLS